MVHPCDMGRVQKIVAHQQIVAVQLHRRAAVHAPSRVIKVLDLENIMRVRKGRITHPNPNKPIFFVQRIGVDLGV